MVWYNNHEIPITQEGTGMKWFHDMSEQEKQSFKKSNCRMRSRGGIHSADPRSFFPFGVKNCGISLWR